MSDTPRHLVCTAARPNVAASFDPRWRTETAVALARGIVADSAPDRLPILANALEEAGCDDLLVLRHCRECPRHFPHCWVLDDLLDRPPVREPPRLTDAEVRRELERVTGRPVEASPAAEWVRPRRGLLWKLIPVLVGLVVFATVQVASRLSPALPTTYTAPTFRTPVVTPLR